MLFLAKLITLPTTSWITICTYFPCCLDNNVITISQNLIIFTPTKSDISHVLITNSYVALRIIIQTFDKNGLFDYI